MKAKTHQKMYQELWKKIRDLIKSIKKRLKLYDMIIIVRSAFHEGNKYCLHVFLDEYLYKLAPRKTNKLLYNR